MIVKRRKRKNTTRKQPARWLFLFLLFIPLISAKSFAQLNNQPFYLPATYQAEKKNDIYINLTTLGFTKNNEYFDRIADGYTLFGYQIMPELVFFPAEQVSISAGVFAWKDFGTNKYSKVAPTFTVDIGWKSLRFLFGTLHGNLEHQLIEPIYDFERVMTNRLENGVQVIYNRERFLADLWINWENMLYEGDPDQEELSGGLVTKYRLLEHERFDLEIPFQIFGMHRGGQIDVSPLPIKTVFNTTFGISGYLKFPESSFFHGIKTDDYLVVYDDLSFEKRDAYREGYAFYLNLALKTKLFDLMISYWNGDKYISNHGGDLYNSRSTTFKHPDYLEPNRELLIFRLLQDIYILDNLCISARLEPYYNFVTRKFNFSHGLYINYKHTFFVKNVTPKVP